MPGRPEMDLAAEDIVAAAIAILDEQGLDAVSMRNVGARLGVSPMPLYRRIGDKEALLAAVAEHLLSDMAPPVKPNEPWQAYASRWAHTIHRRLAQTADLRLLVGTNRSPFVEASKPLIDTLRSQGFQADEAVQACRLLLWAVAGYAAIEHRRPPERGSRTRRRRPGGDPSGVTPAETEHLFRLHVAYLVAGIERDR